MKYILGIIYIICFIAYSYSCYKIIIEPQNSLWGYICALIFLFVSIISVIIYDKIQKKSE